MPADPARDDLAYAEQRVRELLDTIAAARYLNIRVPHGFTLVGVAGERRANLFPEGTEHVHVDARLELPVVFGYRNGCATTADHENLDALRAWITADCHLAPGRIELADWEVHPEGDPPPRRRVEEPDQLWQVRAGFRVDF